MHCPHEVVLGREWSRPGIQDCLVSAAPAVIGLASGWSSWRASLRTTRGRSLRAADC